MFRIVRSVRHIKHAKEKALNINFNFCQLLWNDIEKYPDKEPLVNRNNSLLLYPYQFS